MIDIGQLKQDFIARFGREPRMFRAPGRVNLIGEHTDYNGGFVMPFAIEKAVYVAGALRDDDRIVATSVDFSDLLDVSLSHLDQIAVPTNWTRYPFGVASLLSRSRRNLRGADLLIASDVPDGAGLSSSAALEVGIATALSGLSDLKVSEVDIAAIGQATENEFAGVNSGIMDQMASVLGKAGHALSLDCRSLEWEHIPIAGASFLICDTRTKHSLAETEYNTRRRECEESAKRLGQRSLRDVRVDEIGSLPKPLMNRARHVITENERVLLTVEALRSDGLQTVGELMNASHFSLRDDFEVSSRELDIMSDICRSQPEIFGARMTGGGFGGCTISICRKDADGDSLSARIGSQYTAQTGINPMIFTCAPSEGASEI